MNSSRSIGTQWQKPLDESPALLKISTHCGAAFRETKFSISFDQGEASASFYEVDLGRLSAPSIPVQVQVSHPCFITINA